MSTDRATINNVLEEATARLATGTARLDAEVLLACALQQPRSHLYAWPEQVVTSAVLNTFTGLLQRRAAGEP
ncbi:MAG: protein-(glutamine-N5) methyltransferase, release factor-specific, partial [Gammaproteobacteria bacterium]